LLEMVLTLSNLETARTKLMEIVVAAEPALGAKLAPPALVQVRQRISVVVHLNPLTDRETTEYIDDRLCVAGYGGGSLFTPEARALIAAWSEGVPREINALCSSALSLGYALSRRTIDRKMIEEVVFELERGRPLIAAEAEVPFSAGQHAAPQPPSPGLLSSLDVPLSPDRLLDSPSPTIRAEGTGYASPALPLSMLQRLAVRTSTARAWLVAAAVALSLLLLLLFLGERPHRPRRGPLPAAVGSISHPAEPNESVTRPNEPQSLSTETQKLKNSDRSSEAEAPPAPSVPLPKAEKAQSGEARTSPDSKTLQPDKEEVPPAFSVLVIDEAPPGVQIFVDDQLAASADAGGQARITTLAPGQHRLRLTLNGYREYEQNIDLEPGNTLTVAPRLDPSNVSSAAKIAESPRPAGTSTISPTAESIDDYVHGFVLQRTLQAHSGWVTGVAFSADGLRLASGSWDQTVKFWDVATGQALGHIDGEIKGLEALAFSDDGHWLAAENSTNTVALWDATTGQEIRTLSGNQPSGLLSRGNWVYSIAFSPDSRWLASGVDDKTVRLWEVKTGRAVRDLPGLRRSVIYIAFSPDGRWLASGSDGKTIKIWEVATGREMRNLSGHRKDVYAVAFSPDSRWLASASGDKTVKLWDVVAGREIHTLEGHRNSVTSLAFSPDGRWLASGSWDRTVKIWDVQTGRELQTLAGHKHRVYTVAVDGGGQYLASGSEDGTIELWRLRRPGDRGPGPSR
jgi:WD40 repeat protein